MAVTEVNTRLEQTLGLSSEPDDMGKLYVRGLIDAISVGDNTPPALPAVRTRYVVGPSPNGAWTGRANAIAYNNSDDQWSFNTPSSVNGHGWTVFNRADNLYYGWNGTSWATLGDTSAVEGDITALEGELADEIAARASADTTLGSAITSEATARASADTTLQTNITAEASTRAAADTALGVLIAANSASLGVGQPSTTLDFYVDGVSGSDANDGLTTSTPIQTFTRLYALLPRIYQRDVVVHLAAGSGAGAITYDLPGSIPYFGGARSLWIVGDEAWNTTLGRTLYATVATGTSTTGTGAAAVVSSGLALNAHRGYSIRMTSGAAVTNQKRTIRDNTTTTYSPVAAFSPAPSSGDTYEIFTNNILLRVVDTSTVTAANASVDSRQGVGFIGIDFDAVSGVTTTVPFAPGLVHFFGVRTRTVAITGPLPRGGVQSGRSVDAALIAVFGGTIATAYGGWGLSSETLFLPAGVGVSHTAAGHFVIKGGTTLSGNMSMDGGYLSTLSASVAVAAFGSNGITATPIWIGDTADTATKITCTDGLVTLTTNVAVNNNSASNATIVCERKGAVRLAATTITGSNANATGKSVLCRRGGRVFVTGTPVFGKSGTADWTCEGTTSLMTTLSAADTSIRDAAFPESVIRREA